MLYQSELQRKHSKDNLFPKDTLQRCGCKGVIEACAVNWGFGEGKVFPPGG